jgi:hypothetical protein
LFHLARAEQAWEFLENSPSDSWSHQAASNGFTEKRTTTYSKFHWENEYKYTSPAHRTEITLISIPP